MDASLRVENLAPSPATLATRAVRDRGRRPARRDGNDDRSRAAHRQPHRRPGRLRRHHRPRGRVGPDRDASTATQTTTITLTAPTDLALFTGQRHRSCCRARAPTPRSRPRRPDVDADLSTSVGADGDRHLHLRVRHPSARPAHDRVVPARLHRRPQPRHHLHRGGGRRHGVPARHAHQSPAAGAPCTSPWLGALGAGDDGLYSFSVRATDAAGNVGAASDAQLHPRPDGAPSTSVDVRAAAPRAERRTRRGRSRSRPAPPPAARSTVARPPPAARRSRRTSAPPPTAATPSPSSPSTPPATPARPCSTPTCSIGWPRLAPTITAPPTSPGNDPTPTWA